MSDLLLNPLFRNALLACVIGGASLGLVGGFVMLLDIPFIGVGLSHAAFLGAVAGLLLDWNPLLVSLVSSAAMALVISPMTERSGAGVNLVLGLLFTLTMGLAFLFMAQLPDSRSEALNLMWGNVLTLSRRGLWALSLLSLGVGLFVGFRYNALKAVLFNREIAVASGIHASRMLRTLIILVALVISAALPLVGGLLIFALLINPAFAALHWARRMSTFCLLCSLFGVLACLGGFVLSYYLDTPVGATIVLVSCVIAVLALPFSRSVG